MMQLQNFGLGRVPIVDQAVPLGVVPPPRPNRPNLAWPVLAGLCLLGLILFLIAATIVLALIPIYTSRHDLAATRRSLTSSFNLPLNNNNILNANNFNANQLALLQSAFQNRLDNDRKTKGSSVIVNSASALPNTKRRKRAVLAKSISGTYTIVYPPTVKTTSVNNLNNFTVSNDLLTQLESLRTNSITVTTTTTTTVAGK